MKTILERSEYIIELKRKNDKIIIDNKIERHRREAQMNRINSGIEIIALQASLTGLSILCGASK